MDKLEVQKRVLKNGEPLSLDDFIWDEKTNTFSSVENSLVLDFNWIHDCTFNTDYDCTFHTGFGCTFKINDYKFPIAPLRFNGSRYYIEVSGPSLIRSGCIEKPVKWWQENIKRCAEENSYTPGQVKEYEFYVEILAKWLDRFGKEIQVTNKPEQGGK